MCLPYSNCDSAATKKLTEMSADLLTCPETVHSMKIPGDTSPILLSLSLSLSFIFCWHLCFCELLADSFLMGHELYHVQWVVADDGPRDNSCLFSSSPFRFSSNNQRKQLSQTSSVNRVRSLRFCVVKISPFLTEKWLKTVCEQCRHQCS